MNPICLDLHLASSVSVSTPILVPAIITSPCVGRSIPAMIFRSVVLPEPDGPINATKSPCSISIETSFKTVISCLSRLYVFVKCEIEMSADMIYSFSIVMDVPVDNSSIPEVINVAPGARPAITS